MTQIIRSVAAIGIRPDALSTYLDLHNQQPEAVRDAMRAAHINSYRMYLLKSQNIVISVSERDASTLAADKVRLSSDPLYQDWVRTCRAMQVALPGEAQEQPSLWSALPEVYSL
jgi:L-rhamnose mutarotase